MEDWQDILCKYLPFKTVEEISRNLQVFSESLWLTIIMQGEQNDKNGMPHSCNRQDGTETNMIKSECIYVLTYKCTCSNMVSWAVMREECVLVSDAAISLYPKTNHFSRIAT